MIVYEGRNVNQLLFDMSFRLCEIGEPVQTRNGEAFRFPVPVTTIIHKPKERVLFHPARDANPFFHLMESVAMIAGYNDNKWLSQFNKRMNEFSDNGLRYNAFYGERLRETWGDQLECIILKLIQNGGEDRQLVAQIWDPDDIDKLTKDKACNLCLLFAVRRGKLDMTVYNRSNDLILGQLGANVVHMSYFLEYVAIGSGFDVGSMYTISNNLHAYVEDKKWQAIKASPFTSFTDPYTLKAVTVYNIPFEDRVRLKEECYDFCRLTYPDSEGVLTGTNFRSNWLTEVVLPMYNIWKTRKKLEWLGYRKEQFKKDIDWFVAAKEWLERRGYEC